jgi:hypothetical protein
MLKFLNILMIENARRKSLVKSEKKPGKKRS